jgi:hypothetical protein
MARSRQRPRPTPTTMARRPCCRESARRSPPPPPPDCSHRSPPSEPCAKSDAETPRAGAISIPLRHTLAARCCLSPRAGVPCANAGARAQPTHAPVATRRRPRLQRGRRAVDRRPAARKGSALKGCHAYALVFDDAVLTSLACGEGWGLKGYVFFSRGRIAGGTPAFPAQRVLGARASRSHGSRNALLGNAASKHARKKPYPSKPARRGNRPPARFPSRSGGNLQEGGDCRLCPCDRYYPPLLFFSSSVSSGSTW